MLKGHLNFREFESIAKQKAKLWTHLKDKMKTDHKKRNVQI